MCGPTIPIALCVGPHIERLVFHCRTTGASTPPCTSRRMCWPMHCDSYCVPCQPLLRAFPGWIRSPPPTRTHILVTKHLSPKSCTHPASKSSIQLPSKSTIQLPSKSKQGPEGVSPWRFLAKSVIQLPSKSAKSPVNLWRESCESTRLNRISSSSNIISHKVFIQLF